jgi:hypothetical protein
MGNQEPMNEAMQEDQQEESPLVTSMPTEELVVFGPKREPRPSNKLINKKIKKKDDLIMEDPLLGQPRELLARL